VYIELLYIIGFFATHYFATFSNSSKISRLSKQRIEKEGWGRGEVQKYFANAANNRENHTVSGKRLEKVERIRERVSTFEMSK
jgi:hypothetical protein